MDEARLSLLVVSFVGSGDIWIRGSARETRVRCEVCKSRRPSGQQLRSLCGSFANSMISES